MDNELRATVVTLEPTSTVNEPLWRICKDWSAVEIIGEEVSKKVQEYMYNLILTTKKKQILSNLSIYLTNRSRQEVISAWYCAPHSCSEKTTKQEDQRTKEGEVDVL